MSTVSPAVLSRSGRCGEPMGLKSIGTIPLSTTKLKNSSCWKCGCSSISLQAGLIAASRKTSRSLGIVMFEVPM